MQTIRHALDAYAASSPARFHMPGHKGTLDLIAAPYDITELGFSDNLLAPTGLLKAAQERAAAFYNARQTLFLTGGSTAGLHAMLLALGPVKLLVARNCHKSVLSGLVLSGGSPIWVAPVFDERYGHTVVTPEAVRAALQAHPDAAALLLTSPTYYGECADLAGIREALGDRPLLLDEAHGAHLALLGDPRLDASPHADLRVQSAHKTLRAPNQSAYLHISPRCPDHLAARAADCVKLVQTTSPSYPMLAALDEAYTQPGWQACAAHVQALYGALPEGCTVRQAGVLHDPTRIRIDVAGAGVSGFEAEAFLQSRCVFMEMADHRCVIGIATPCDQAAWYDRLLGALAKLPRGRQGPPAPTRLIESHSALTPREAAFAPAEDVPLERCEGRISAVSAGAYPPATPFALPGDYVSPGCVAALQTALQSGIAFGLGAQNHGPTLRCVIQ